MTTTPYQLTSLRPGGDKGNGANPDAWKSKVGNKPIGARLCILPDSKPRLSALGTSLTVQIAIAAFLVLLPQLFPQKMIPKVMSMVTEIAGPPLDIPKPPAVKPPPVVKVKVQPPPPVVQPKPVVVAKFLAPTIEPPKPKLQPVKEADLPKVNETLEPMKMDLAKPEAPARPRDPIKTGVMNTGSTAPATINKPVEKIQTGGFGDPNGATGPSDPSKRATIAAFGSPALPPGPGYGNGTGGANGARGVVASTGFGNGTAIPPAGNTHRTGVQSGAFTDGNNQVVEAPKKKTDDAAAVESVIILSKPKPIYTAEAIQMRLEGDVLLDVIFPASGGAVHVNRVVKGLGHGLDEAAVRAAEQIKFKPAISAGHSVDFPAVIHIVFEMAY